MNDQITSAVESDPIAEKAKAIDAIFVIGYLHSGTTLLQKILSRHPMLFVGSGETRLFDSLPMIYAQYPDIREESAFAAYIQFLIRLVQAGFNPAMYDSNGSYSEVIQIAPSEDTVAEIAALAADARYHNDRLAVFPIVQTYIAGRLGKQIWVEKTPTHLFHIPKILEVVPNAVFLEMVRDPRAILASKQKRLSRGGNYDPIWDNLAWKSAIHTTEKLSPAMAARVLRIRYWDLAHEPQAQVERICSFLNIPFVDGMLDVGWVNSTTSQSTESGGISTSAVKSWEQVLSKETVAVTQLLTKPEMARLNYEPIAVPAAAWLKVPFMPLRSAAEFFMRLGKRWRRHGFAGFTTALNNYGLRLVGLSKRPEQ